MASTYKRASDKAKGKRGVWTMAWRGEDGKRKTRAGFTDRAESQKLADHLEREAAKVRAGLVEPGEMRRREAALKPLETHIVEYEANLLAKGDKAKHAHDTASAIRRLLASALVESIADMGPDRIQEALGRLKTSRSARTANYALGAVRSFAKWLVKAKRIRESTVDHLTPYNVEADRKYIRRALSKAELVKLLAAAESGPDVFVYGPTKSKHHKVPITGPDRAMLYRLAMATGFRANELRSLTPESFNLGAEPTITVKPTISKRGQADVQPISQDMAAVFRPWLATRALGQPVLEVPKKTARLLHGDLERAGIPIKDAKGEILDFHALRHSYITHLVQSGVNPKVVQSLARHSTITLTLDRYTHVDEADKRRALDGESGDPPTPLQT